MTHTPRTERGRTEVRRDIEPTAGGPRGDEDVAASADSYVRSGRVAEALRCPISRQVLEDPVSTRRGSVYSRGPIAAWLTANDTDPVTGVHLRTRQLMVHRPTRARLEVFWSEVARIHGANATVQRAVQVIQRHVRRYLAGPRAHGRHEALPGRATGAPGAAGVRHQDIEATLLQLLDEASPAARRQTFHGPTWSLSLSMASASEPIPAGLVRALEDVLEREGLCALPPSGWMTLHMYAEASYFALCAALALSVWARWHRDRLPSLSDASVDSVLALLNSINILHTLRRFWGSFIRPPGSSRRHPGYITAREFFCLTSTAALAGAAFGHSCMMLRRG